jgi:hypothetical protein
VEQVKVEDGGHPRSGQQQVPVTLAFLAPNKSPTKSRMFSKLSR